MDILTSKQKFAEISNKKLFLSVLLLVVLNAILVSILAIRTGVHNLDGTYSQANSPAVIITAIMGIIITLPVMCLILAFVTTIFINKTLPYKKRYLRGFLWTILFVNILVFIRFTYNVFLG